MNILRSLSVISYMMNFILSTKVSMSKQKICLYSALVSVFCFRFMVLIASCFFLKRRKKLFSHGFPPNFDQYVDSRKTKKNNKYDWYEHDLMTYFDDLKYEQLASNTDECFKRAHIFNSDIINHDC